MTYLKDSQDVNLSRTIAHSFSGKDQFLDFNNCVVKEVKKDEQNANSLILRMVGEYGLEGTSWIRSRNEKGNAILDKILESKAVLELTLNDLFYLDLDKI